MTTILQRPKTNVYFLSFLAVLAVGLAVRVFDVSTIPAGFFCDEASIGYNAYSILLTGADEFGARFPIFYRAFGEYKNPVQMYSTIPFVSLFGLSEFSTRLTSITYGVLALVAVYLLAKELFKQSKQANLLALLSMVFLAVSPWAIHFSRVSLEGLMPFVFFTTLGLYILLRAQVTPRLLPLSIGSFAFALYSYFPARLFVPLFGIGLFVIFFRFFLSHRKETIVSLVILIVLLVPFIQSLLSPTGLARWQQVNIFSSPPKDRTVAQQIASSYLQHFSADFLFVKGDIDMPGQFVTRHSVRGVGELYLVQLPLVAFGLFSLLMKREKALFILLLWLVLYPVGSIFTTDRTPQGTRSIIGVVPFQVLSAVGTVYLLRIVRRVNKGLAFASIGVASVIIGVSFAQYLSLYFISYPNYASDFRGWQYGPREIVQHFVALAGDYDDFVMAPEFNAPGIFLKFYAPDGCKNCRIGLPSDAYIEGKRQLFAVTPAYMANHIGFKYTPVRTIYYPNGNAAFVLTTVTPTSLAKTTPVQYWGSAGTGPGQFDRPRDLVIDTSDSLYVLDYGNQRIQKFSLTGEFLISWGERGDGEGRFRDLTGLALGPDGLIYALDSDDGIQKFDAYGNLRGRLDLRKLATYHPRGLAIDKQGSIYLADTGGARVLKLDPNGTRLASWGARGKDEGQFVEPSSVAVDQDGMVYVADADNNRIQEFDQDGHFLRQWPLPADRGGFNGPRLSLDSRGALYATGSNNQLFVFNRDGELEAAYGADSGDSVRMQTPRGIAVDRQGQIYVSESGANRITKLAVRGR